MLKVSYNRGAETMICRLAVAAGSTDCAAGMVEGGADLARPPAWTSRRRSLHRRVRPDRQPRSRRRTRCSSQTIMAAAPGRRAVEGDAADPRRRRLARAGQAGRPGRRARSSAKTGTLFGGDLFNDSATASPPRRSAATSTRSRAGGSRSRSSSTDSVFPDVQGVFAANDDVGDVAAAIQQAN